MNACSHCRIILLFIQPEILINLVVIILFLASLNAIQDNKIVGTNDRP